MNVPLGPAPADISGVRAGDLNEFQVTITAGGKPVDLTDQAITASARHSKSDPDHLDAVITVVDALKGILIVRWPGDAVRSWLDGKDDSQGFWDLEAQSGEDDPTTWMAGTFYAEMDVTHADSDT